MQVYNIVTKGSYIIGEYVDGMVKVNLFLSDRIPVAVGHRDSLFKAWFNRI